MPKLKTTKKQHIKINEPMLELDAQRGAISEDFEDNIAAAQQKEEELKHQLEQVEIKKKELEDLNARKAEFLEGQSDVLDRLENVITGVDRKLFDMHEEMADLEQTRKCFAEHLQKIDHINHEAWTRDDLKKELTKSISLIDHAEDEYEEAVDYFSDSSLAEIFGNAPKKANKKNVTPATTSEFQTMFKQGLAFNLPIVLLGALALLVYLIK